MIVRRDCERSIRCVGRGAKCVVRQNHSLGCPGRSTRGHHESVIGQGRTSRLEIRATRSIDDGTGSHCCTEPPLGQVVESLIDGKHGFAGIPDPAQLVDELRPSRKVERYESRHAPMLRPAQ